MWWSWSMSPNEPSNELSLFTLNCLGHGKVAFFIRGFNGCQKVLDCQLVVSGCILEKNLIHPQNVQFIASFKTLNSMMNYKGRRTSSNHTFQKEKVNYLLLEKANFSTIYASWHDSRNLYTTADVVVMVDPPFPTVLGWTPKRFQRKRATC